MQTHPSALSDCGFMRRHSLRYEIIYLTYLWFCMLTGKIHIITLRERERERERTRGRERFVQGLTWHNLFQAHDYRNLWGPNTSSLKYMPSRLNYYLSLK